VSAVSECSECSQSEQSVSGAALRVKLVAPHGVGQTRLGVWYGHTPVSPVIRPWREPGVVTVRWPALRM